MKMEERILNSDEYFREFEFENKRADGYFDLMYKIFQFTFALVVALLAIVFSDKTLPIYSNLILRYVLPICLYVFGIMYTYNAYALAICGERAEKLHQKIYEDADIKQFRDRNFYSVLSKYVATNRIITLLSYGLALGFYLTIPIASVYVGGHYFTNMFADNKLFTLLPPVFNIIYIILEMIVICAIGKHYLVVRKIQKQNNNQKHEEDKTMDFITLGERILIYRKRKGLTKKELAEKLGVNATDITNYEEDKTQPNTDILTKLASEFNKSVDELIYGA